MHRALVAVAVLTVAATLVSDCASAALPPGEGAVLYRKKCGGCHRIYAPSDFKGPRWEERLTLMTTRAKLTQEEATTIRSYVAANREGTPRPQAGPQD